MAINTAFLPKSVQAALAANPDLYKRSTTAARDRANSLGLNIDYDLTEPTGTPTFSTVAVEGWGTGLWGTALWSGSGGNAQALRRDWQTVGAIGYAGALYLKGASKNADVRW